MRKALLYISILLTLIPTAAQAQVWSPLAAGLPSAPISMHTSGNQIATAHFLRSTDTSRIFEIRRWNGIYWQTLPSLELPQNGIIKDVAIIGRAIYIGGTFSQANGLDSSKNIIRWQNQQYESIPSFWRDMKRFEGVRQFSIVENKLLAIGKWTTAEDIQGMQYYDGKFVLPFPDALGIGPGGEPTCISTDGETVAIGGRFGKVNDSLSVFAASYTNGGWNRYSTNTIVPDHIATTKGHVYIAGNTLAGQHYGIYQISDTLVDTLTSNITAIDKVYDLKVIDGQLYAAGIFYLDDKLLASRIIQWKDSLWEAIQNDNLVGTTILSEYQGSLLASGFFTSSILGELNHVARYSKNAGVLSAKIFFDKNRNCEREDIEEGLNFIGLKVEPIGIVLRPDKDGRVLTVLPAGTYSISPLETKNWFINEDCVAKSRKVTISAGQLNDSALFPHLREIGKRDLAIKLIAYGGNNAQNNKRNAYRLIYSNIGTEDIANTTVKLFFREKFNALVSKPAADEQSVDSASWVIRNLYAGQSGFIDISLEVATDAVTEPIELSASIGLQEEDVDLHDNTSELTQALGENTYEFRKNIIGSESDTAYFNAETKSIGYQILFRNFSLDTVQTVHVVDTIKLNHSMSYIKEVASTHPYTTTVIPGVPGTDVGILIFSFHNLNLAPNPEKYLDKVESLGYIMFEIGIKPDLTEGLTLHNTAHVSFDYFEPEKTNAVVAVIDNTKLGVSPAPSQQILLYPNPCNDRIFLPTLAAKSRIQIYNTQGKLMLEKENPNDSIDVRHLPSGIYIVSILEGENKRYARIVKR